MPETPLTERSTIAVLAAYIVAVEAVGSALTPEARQSAVRVCEEAHGILTERNASLAVSGIPFGHMEDV